MAGRGHDVKVVHPTKVKPLMRAKAKNDKNDAYMLADLLRAGCLEGIYVPDKDVRDMRDLTRHRGSLVRKKGELKRERSYTAPCAIYQDTLSLADPAFIAKALKGEDHRLGRGRSMFERHLGRFHRHHTFLRANVFRKTAPAAPEDVTEHFISWLEAFYISSGILDHPRLVAS
ncbi:MAG: transposase [Euryarchaeota archaeon]|nr:transposase [Euryarchaeota archaeon]